MRRRRKQKAKKEKKERGGGGGGEKGLRENEAVARRRSTICDGRGIIYLYRCWLGFWFFHFYFLFFLNFLSYNFTDSTRRPSQLWWYTCGISTTILYIFFFTFLCFTFLCFRFFMLFYVLLLLFYVSTFYVLRFTVLYGHFWVPSSSAFSHSSVAFLLTQREYDDHIIVFIFYSFMHTTAVIYSTRLCVWCTHIGWYRVFIYITRPLYLMCTLSLCVYILC